MSIIMLLISIVLLLTLSYATSTCDQTLCNCVNQTCLSCRAAFFFPSNNTCLLCPQQCASCSNTLTCYSCNPYFYLNNSTCTLCPQYCISCTPTCTQCMIGYALVNNACLACQSSNVLTCTTPQTILSCQSGYWQNGNSCSPCRQFCLVCSSPSNCLQCQSGYQVLVSFGSYCSACGTGCQTCSSSLCTACFYNYKLVGGVCVSIETACRNLANCASCLYSNGQIICYVCNYPYYLKNATCVLGSSLLCQGGSIGPMYYQCIDSCKVLSYDLQSFSNGIVCAASPWIGNLQQLYLSPYDLIFYNMTYQTNSQLIVYTPLFSNQSSSSLTFNLNINPYYKLALFFKLIAVNVQNSTVQINLNMVDNSSTIQNYNFTTSTYSNYQPIYFNLTTKNIKDQLVTFNLITITNSSYGPIVGLSQLLIQIYPCPTNCRLCYNGQLCKSCISTYFSTPEYSCVSSCIGYIQLYQPTGNPLNYTAKSCVLSCPSSFYTLQNGTQYICILCTGLCLTCLSSTQCLTCISPYLYYQIDFSCVLDCPITHYQSASTCTPCHPPCSTCLNSTTCLTCSIGYFYSGSCLGNCPAGTYQNNTNNICINCDMKCSTCAGSFNYCLSCNTPYLLYESTCVSYCSSNLYYQTDNACLACVSPCLTCLTNISCLSCSTGYLYQYQCLTVCPNGYFADSANSVCLPCQNGCLSCLSSTICFSCPNATSLYGYSCVSSCPQNSYSSNNLCVGCLSPCSDCINQSYCLSCSTGYLSALALGKCLSLCQNGYYGSSINSSCLPCSSNCSTCQKSAYICQSCLSGLLLQNSACVSSCSKGYYNYSRNCLPCSYPCLSCQVNDYTCTSCSSNYILLNFTCINQCPQSSFLSGSTCSMCQSPCQTCLSLTICLSCYPNDFNSTYLYESSCVSICPDGTYSDNLTLTCRNCLYPCGNCLSQSLCLSCITGYLNPSLSSCELCSGNFFANDTSKQCQACSTAISYCQSCASSTQCLNCQTNYLLNNNTCITADQCVALSIYYIDDSISVCIACISPCLTCLHQSYCLSCLSGLYLSGQCLTSCPTAYYPQSSQACLVCSAQCLTCSNSTACTSCNSSASLNVYFPSQLSCISSSECPIGYYLDNSYGWLQCLPCVLPCSTCTNSTFCLSCVYGINYKGSCKSSCPSGYFVNKSNSTLPLCEICDSNCFKCTSKATFCTSCSSTLYLKNNTCVTNCANGYYLDITIYSCFSCVLPCYTCSSLSICTSCANSSTILYFGQCLNSCLDGTYQYNKTCQQCPSSCLKCYLNSSTNSTPLCSKCIVGLYLSSTMPGLCLPTCATSEYGDLISRNCYSCIPPCLSCSNAITCLSCNNNYLLYKTQCLFISRCPTDSYKLNQICLENCSSLWADSASAACLTNCLPPSLKMAKDIYNYCVPNCPSSYYVSLDYLCQPCKYSICDSLLSISVDSKSIFNILYIKLTFSQTLNLNVLNQTMLTVALSSGNARLLSQNTINFTISQINLNALWLQLTLNQSIYAQNIIVTFQNYYILNVPLQSLTYSTYISQYDYYTPQDSSPGLTLQHFSQTMSIIMLFLFAVNLVLNSGHLSYTTIDNYQLLFMILFLSIDYPPPLNHFLYGFRYSHYLFLPQIFRNNPAEDYTTSTPDKFGVVVPDVSFLRNTGHDFIIIIASLSVLLLCKITEIIFIKISQCRKNKVEDTFAHKTEPSQSCVVRVVQTLISRFKWNYFNDVIYSIYFSIMLFAFSQLYDLEWHSQNATDMLSIILAFVFMTLGILLPFLLGYLLNRNEQDLIQNSLQQQKQQIQIKKQQTAHSHKQQSQHSNFDEVLKNDQPQPISEKSSTRSQNIHYQILTDYKCFLSGVKLKVRIGFYHIPIRYLKKLIMAALLVYCSQYPSFVLGVSIMLCFINIISTIILQPFRMTFQQILHPLFETVSLLLFLTICIMQLPLLHLSVPQKLTASYICIALSVLLSCLLAIHNIIINTVQVIKFFCKIDYFSKYYSTEYVETDSEHMTQQQTNTPLKKQFLSQKNEEEPSDIFSGLDIYLKKESTAPQFLIKCVKPKSREEPIAVQSGDKAQQVPNIFQRRQEQQSIRFTNEKLSNVEDLSYQSEQNRQHKNTMQAELAPKISVLNLESEIFTNNSQQHT